MPKTTLTPQQLRALTKLADGKERLVSECGATSTLESLRARGLIDWRTGERRYLRRRQLVDLAPDALVTINDDGLACLPKMSS
jgi:DNA-binding MarR family transcriptional regulator